MKRQRSIPQGALSRLFQQAAEAWRRQEYQQTLDLLERAARLDPANANVLFDLGRAYGLRYQYGAAERCLEKAIRLTPRKSEALAEAARRCQEFGHYAMAKGFLERALQEQSASADALVTLAELYERGHRLGEAYDLVERALRLEQTHPRALLGQARLQRSDGRLEEAERSARTLLASTSCDVTTRIRAWYELGGILDRQHRFDEAMSAFLEAKALQRPAAAQAIAILIGVQAHVKELEQTATVDLLERWAAGAEALAPTRRLAILCGHPRSGTTLLEQVLDSHPEIVTAEETHILHDEAYLPLTRGFAASTSVAQVLDAVSPDQLRQSRESYFRLTELFIQRRIEGRLLVDKNPALNVLIPAVVRLFPEARLLVALRDPRDVCLSCFMQYLPLNPVASAYLTLEGTVRQYGSVMGFWRALLPRLKNPWLEVRYEKMIEDLEGVTRRTLAFLDVPWNASVLRFYEAARQKPLRSPSYADVTRPVYRGALGRWRHYAKHLEPVLPALEPFLQAFGYAN
jgi:tetratricopeptide (TPR) repeat protein